MINRANDVYIDIVDGTTAVSQTTFNNLQQLIKADILNTKNEILQLTFPKGSKYITQNKNTNPNSILGFGTWQLSEGEFLVGIKDGDTDFASFNQRGGSKYLQAHTHTGSTGAGITSQMRHVASAGTNIAANHTVGFSPANYVDKTGNNFAGANHYHQFTTNSTGNGNSGNLPPYRVVGYVWVRTQ